MSKVLRMLGALTLATATVPFLGVGPAAASETTISPSTTGYFYAEGIRKPDESPAAPPNLTGQHTDGVAAGNLAVAAQGGQEDKVSFLLFDLLDVVPGSVVSKATLTLPLVENSPPENVSYGQDPVKVRACAAGDEGFNGDDSSSIQDAPARKCDVFAAPAKASADGKAYVIDITKLAQTWVDSANDGVALTAADGAATTPFQVVFAGDKVKLAVSFTAGSVTPPVAPPVLGGVTPPSTGFNGGVAPAPPVDAGFGAVAQPLTPVAPAPAPGIAPAPAAAPAAAAPAVPVALSTSVRPSNQFWLGGLLLAVVLVLLSLIMGDTTVAAANARPTRLARALSARQRGIGTTPGFGRPATI